MTSKNSQSKKIAEGKWLKIRVDYLEDPLKPSKRPVCMCGYMLTIWSLNKSPVTGVNAEVLLFEKPRHWRPATGDGILQKIPHPCQGLLIIGAPAENWRGWSSLHFIVSLGLPQLRCPPKKLKSFKRKLEDSTADVVPYMYPKPIY